MKSSTFKLMKQNFHVTTQSTVFLILPVVMFCFKK